MSALDALYKSMLGVQRVISLNLARKRRHLHSVQRRYNVNLNFNWGQILSPHFPVFITSSTASTISKSTIKIFNQAAALHFLKLKTLTLAFQIKFQRQPNAFTLHQKCGQHFKIKIFLCELASVVQCSNGNAVASFLYKVRIQVNQVASVSQMRCYDLRTRFHKYNIHSLRSF